MFFIQFQSAHQVSVLRKVLPIKDVNCVPENQPVRDKLVFKINRFKIGVKLSSQCSLQGQLQQNVANKIFIKFCL